jgi:hypothetical protein
MEEIEEYDRQIQDTMGNIPHGDIFTSLPGADYILGANTISELKYDIRSLYAWIGFFMLDSHYLQIWDLVT